MRRIHGSLACLCLLCVLVLESDRAQDVLLVTVTAYAPTGSPTAAGVVPSVGTIALSRDIEETLQIHFGEHVCLGGLGRYVFADRMPWYWHRRVDIFLTSAARARHFGIVRRVTIQRCAAMF